ncbi:MAG: glycoside hydrolase family 55 protein [bacterium]|nr:glycoside hydrolase family 55 protein [bacterium]
MAAQKLVGSSGGGVVYFPAGNYHFEDHVELLNGVVLRGDNPRGATSAHDKNYSPVVSKKWNEVFKRISSKRSWLDAVKSQPISQARTNLS